MKGCKRISAWLLACLLLISALPAMAVEQTKPSPYTEVNTQKKLTLTIDSMEYTGYTLNLNLRLRNKTRRDYGYGYKYNLEQEIDGVWYEQPVQIDFPAIGLVLWAGKTAKLSPELNSKYMLAGENGLLAPGKYRLVYTLIDEETKQLHHLAAVFYMPEPGFAYAKEPVNLRTGPGTEHDIIRELKLAEEVRTICKQGKWTMVRAGEQHGYVYSKYLSFDEATPYYKHPAAKLLGKKNIQGIGVIADMGQFNSEKMISMMLKKPYANSLNLRVFLYPNAEVAKAQFQELTKDGLMFIPDVYYSYYYAEDYIIQWSRDGFSDSRKVLQFYREMKTKLESAYPMHTD